MDIHPFISEPPENHQPQGNEAMKTTAVYIVRIERQLGDEDFQSGGVSSHEEAIKQLQTELQAAFDDDGSLSGRFQIVDRAEY